MNIHAEKGGDLILAGRNQEKMDAQAKRVSDQYGVTAHTIAVDLSRAKNGVKTEKNLYRPRMGETERKSLGEQRFVNSNNTKTVNKCQNMDCFNRGYSIIYNWFEVYFCVSLCHYIFQHFGQVLGKVPAGQALSVDHKGKRMPVIMI